MQLKFAVSLYVQNRDGPPAYATTRKVGHRGDYSSSIKKKFALIGTTSLVFRYLKLMACLQCQPFAVIREKKRFFSFSINHRSHVKCCVFVYEAYQCISVLSKGDNLSDSEDTGLNELVHAGSI